MASKNMEGRICLITGATSGIGLVTARELAKQGATVIVHGRSKEKCEQVVKDVKTISGNSNVEFMLADLSKLSDVRNLAEEFKNRYNRLHVLINNAGAVYMRREETADGFEMTFGVNHISHFLLTNLLLDILKASAPSRIINVSSRAHERGKIDFNDLQARKRYFAMTAYGQSKLANVLFTYELARRLEGTNVSVNALHPGFVASGFGMNNNLMKLLRPIVKLIAISPEEGAKTTIYLATSPEAEGVSGKYFVERKAVKSSPASYDKEAAERLWKISEELTGIRWKE